MQSQSALVMFLHKKDKHCSTAKSNQEEFRQSAMSFVLRLRHAGGGRTIRPSGFRVEGLGSRGP